MYMYIYVYIYIYIYIYILNYQILFILFFCRDSQRKSERAK